MSADLPVRRAFIWGAKTGARTDPSDQPTSIADDEIERVPNVQDCYICGAGLVLLGIAYVDPMWVFECDGGHHRFLLGERAFGGAR
jgi:hypothetical protein